MEKDFHYYCVGVLARAGGFTKKDALKIAYASQYVDDSTESKPIRVGLHLFDPVRTAHNGLRSYTDAVQRKIFVPFHFIPKEPITKDCSSYETLPDSDFAKYILNSSANELNHDLKLYRLGIALHTYADTWAHQGFSGKKNEWNNVEEIYLKDGYKWKKPQIKKILLSLLPRIGHAKASSFPDKPFLKWKFTRKLFRKTIERDNTKEFLKAAEKIYLILRKIEKPYPEEIIIPWKEIDEKIHERLAYSKNDLAKRSEKWREEFEYLFHPYSFEYDKNLWRKKALCSEDSSEIEWDDFEPSDFKDLNFKLKKDFYQTSWVQFHRAASKQRKLVLNYISKN